MVLVLTLSLLAAAPTPAPEAPTTAQLEERAGALLKAWASHDVRQVVALLDPAVLFLGPDVSEACTERGCVEQLLADDFALWDSGHFGPLKGVHVRTAPGLGVAAFDATFESVTRGQAKAQPCRFSTTWKKVGAEWKLTQLVLAHPTVGASGKDLAKENQLK
jgi:hypothetical protein